MGRKRRRDGFYFANFRFWVGKNKSCLWDKLLHVGYFNLLSDICFTYLSLDRLTVCSHLTLPTGKKTKKMYEKFKKYLPAVEMKYRGSTTLLYQPDFSLNVLEKIIEERDNYQAEHQAELNETKKAKIAEKKSKSSSKPKPAHRPQKINNEALEILKEAISEGEIGAQSRRRNDVGYCVGRSVPELRKILQKNDIEVSESTVRRVFVAPHKGRTASRYYKGLINARMVNKLTNNLRVKIIKNRVWNGYLCNWKTGPKNNLDCPFLRHHSNRHRSRHLPRPPHRQKRLEIRQEQVQHSINRQYGQAQKR